MTLAGAVLPIGVGGDPWDTPSPSRRFAEELHRFSWLPAALALGPEGVREALRLTLDWEALFGRPSGFSWSPPVLERRVYNLSCGLRPLLAAAPDAERARLLRTLARQARVLDGTDDGPLRAAERAAVAAVAAGTLDPGAGAGLPARALERLEPALSEAVLPDGGHRSRSPEAGLELLFDLLTLDDVLNQRGAAAPDVLSRSLDRLTAAARFFTLGDGRLAAFQGGEAAEPARVAAARVREAPDAAPPFAYAPHSGYQRLTGRRLKCMVDAGAPAAGDWSLHACAQSLALEVTAGRDRLIANTGWSPQAVGPAALRLAAAGSTAALEDASPGAPLAGFRAAALGPRLVGAPATVEVRRNEDDADNVWIELSHAGWVPRFGCGHERRLFMDAAADELRGEDRFVPERSLDAPLRYAVRFHLHPDVRAVPTQDGRGVTLRGATSGAWTFRSDAPETALEPSAVFAGGLPRRTEQIVLRGEVDPRRGARVRWKLAPEEG